MIQHFVCFQFKEGTSEEATQQHLAMFAALPSQIPQIAEYAGGLVVSGNTEKYTTAHNVVFRSLEDLAIYDKHEAHQAFIAANKAIWEDVLVVDSAY